MELDDETRVWLFLCFLKALGEEGRARFLAYIKATEGGTKAIADEYVPGEDEA
jgi:hypothetical protein